MDRIFKGAKEVIVWLGEEDDRSQKLCEYARKMARGENAREKWSPRSALDKVLSRRQLQTALQKLLERRWFSRLWVIPEVALSNFTVVAIGDTIVSWDNLVRLIRDTQLPQNAGFDKKTALLGNPRQRIAIISQMVASQRDGLLHTDVTQLLILAKSSDSTDLRDKVYAFFGMTLLRLRPDYRDLPDHKSSVERLYVDVAQHYVNSILWDDYYSRWHGLTEQSRIQQLTSIIYSAGRLHQHFDLPSWVPDWTFAWYQAPFWCRTDSNMTTPSARDEWSARIRSDYRAGGHKLETFEIVDSSHGRPQLKISALLFDSITEVSEKTPARSPAPHAHGPTSPVGSSVTLDSPIFSYGRDYFTTSKGLLGMATEDILPGDQLAVFLGGDVPVVLRPAGDTETDDQAFILLCECYVQSDGVMNGHLLETAWTSAADVRIV